MKGLFEIAAKHQRSRDEWMTDLDNPDAQRFYTALGFPPYRSKVFYRVQGEELLRAAGDDIPAPAQDRS